MGRLFVLYRLFSHFIVKNVKTRVRQKQGSAEFGPGAKSTSFGSLLGSAKNHKFHNRDWPFQAGLHPWPEDLCSLSEILSYANFLFFVYLLLSPFLFPELVSVWLFSVSLSSLLLSLCFLPHTVSLSWMSLFTSVKLSGTISLMMKLLQRSSVVFPRFWS